MPVRGHYGSGGGAAQSAAAANRAAQQQLTAFLQTALQQQLAAGGGPGGAAGAGPGGVPGGAGGDAEQQARALAALTAAAAASGLVLPGLPGMPGGGLLGMLTGLGGSGPGAGASPTQGKPGTSPPLPGGLLSANKAPPPPGMPGQPPPLGPSAQLGGGGMGPGGEEQHMAASYMGGPEPTDDDGGFHDMGPMGHIIKQEQHVLNLGGPTQPPGSGGSAGLGHKQEPATGMPPSAAALFMDTSESPMGKGPAPGPGGLPPGFAAGSDGGSPAPGSGGPVLNLGGLLGPQPHGQAARGGHGCGGGAQQFQVSSELSPSAAAHTAAPPSGKPVLDLGPSPAPPPAGPGVAQPAPAAAGGGRRGKRGTEAALDLGGPVGGGSGPADQDAPGSAGAGVVLNLGGTPPATKRRRGDADAH